MYGTILALVWICKHYHVYRDCSGYLSLWVSPWWRIYVWVNWITDWRRPGDKPLSEPIMVRLPTHICVTRPQWVNTLRPRQNGRRFADGTFKHIFWNENIRISINISLKFVPKGQINNNPVLVQIMAWRRPGDKPLSEPMVVSLLTHICVTRPQWVKQYPR